MHNSSKVYTAQELAAWMKKWDNIERSRHDFLLIKKKSPQLNWLSSSIFCEPVSLAKAYPTIFKVVPCRKIIKRRNIYDLDR